MNTASSFASMASCNAVRGSVTKLVPIARMIRGSSASFAMSKLRFCKKRSALDFYKIIRSAIANAQRANSNCDISKLLIGRIDLGRGPSMKRTLPRAHGRAHKMVRRWSNVRICLLSE